MSLLIKRDKRYTYNDYLKWPNEEKWEIIDGEAYNMSPAPTLRHQKVVGRIFAFLEYKLKGKACIPFIAPTDVILSEYDIIQPDILVVCDKKKLTEANIQGAPDLVIEVLSPSTSLKDTREKKVCYEKYGVKEYIIVHPDNRYVERFTLGKKKKFDKTEIFGPDEKLPLKSLQEIEISLVEVFEEIMPEESKEDEKIN